MFGAGAMGTAVAMHAARRGHDVTLWGSAFDLQALEHLVADRKHPSCASICPRVRVCGPEELSAAADGAQFVVLGANSHGARSLASMVRDHVREALVAISVAKGLEPGTGKRMSQVYGEELQGVPIVAVGGPCLATELARAYRPRACGRGPRSRSPARPAPRSTRRATS